MSLYDLVNRNTNVSQWENPANSTDLLRNTRQVSPKSLGSKDKIDNVRSETLVTRRRDPRSEDHQDGTPVYENLMVRITTSASAASAAELEKMLDTAYWFHKSNFAAIAAGRVLPLTTDVVVNPVLTTTVTP